MEPYLTIEQVAAGWHVHHHTVRRYVASGELPATRVGKRLLFHADDIAAFMRRRVVRPRAAA